MDRPGAILMALQAALLASLAVSPADAQRVRITKLSDVDFGLISNLQTDSRLSQNLCVYVNGQQSTYSVTAMGSGAGSAFSLSSGLHTLPYEVEWSSLSGQSNGIPLAPNVALTSQTTSATQQVCNNGPATTASLSLILRSSELGRARAGDYNGSLTLIIAGE